MQFNDQVTIKSPDQPIFDAEHRRRRFRADNYFIRAAYYGDGGLTAYRTGPVLNQNGTEHQGGHTESIEIELSAVPVVVLEQAAEFFKDQAEKAAAYFTRLADTAAKRATAVH